MRSLVAWGDPGGLSFVSFIVAGKDPIEILYVVLASRCGADTLRATQADCWLPSARNSKA